ncbi:MAG: MobV family relaxase [Pseudomonadota bacterium]
MAYCIMRFQKLKAASMGSLAGSLAHTMRSRYTPNADPELIKDNKVLLGPESTADVVQAVRDRWPEKHRKDAVGCIEYFIGASPEWFKKHGGHGDQDAYFQHAIDWLKSEYGEENVVSVVQHNDETSPHLAAYVVPVDEYGKLNAKQWTGGRAACARMQTRFQEAAGEPVGLERGIRGSKAEHLTIQRWYEHNKTLDQREQTVYGEEIGLEIREQALREQSDAHSSEIREMESAVRADREAVREREQEAARKATELAQKAESISNRANVLDERENGLQSKSDALQQQSEAVSKKERQLSALERELASRGETLAGGEAALEKRQAEIDAAGEQLRQRLESAKQQQQAFEAQKREFEQQRAAWLESNRPQVPELVTKLLKLREMGRLEAAEYMNMPENDELFDHYDPIDMSYSAEALELLDKHAGAAEEVRRWERTVEPPKGFKPPEM